MADERARSDEQALHSNNEKTRRRKTMRVFERIGRIVRADAHGMMDQLEERSLLLKQHLREAELEVTQKRAKLEAIEEERRRLSEDGQRLEVQVAALDEDVELAMGGDDAELARFAVRRLLPKREALRALFARAAQLDERRTRLQSRLEEQEAQLVELRPRVRAALDRPDPEPVEWTGDSVVTDEEIELELLRRHDHRNDRREDAARTGEGRR
jgi:phage shock protein A